MAAPRTLRFVPYSEWSTLSEFGLVLFDDPPAVSSPLFDSEPSDLRFLRYCERRMSSEIWRNAVMFRLDRVMQNCV